jgi:hypothetical protein
MFLIDTPDEDDSNCNMDSDNQTSVSDQDSIDQTLSASDDNDTDSFFFPIVLFLSLESHIEEKKMVRTTVEFVWLSFLDYL